ncbi:ankyrin repeat domain-containing protein SOWAHD-like [Leucoraja erinacea]|uniref:ankyrin repeat domain-containing protein SOWAHD-like n=1 Tax=Leucoraja erinaceus TaxID=7782 RepID=UPI0024581D4C|nr:ankyrin repeat domain-containing protein SOWAHD-like [Leucoraja erinacea]
MATLLERDPGLLNRRDPVSGLTATHWLAKRGDVEALLELRRLAGRAGLRLDVDLRAGGAGYTPLHLAAMQGHHMVIKLLVGAYNANVDARDYAGRKAWQYLGSGTPGKLRDLAGAQEEERPPRTGAQRAEQAHGPQKKTQSFAIVSMQNFFQLKYWRQWRSQRSAD